MLVGCGGRYIASAQLGPSLADATAVPRVSANTTTNAGAETSWSTDPTGLPKNAAQLRGKEKAVAVPGSACG